MVPNKIGQTACKICPVRFYCPWQDEDPVPCDPKAICPAGSWKPKEECSGLYKRNKETEECELSSIVYAVIGVVLAVIVAGIGFVIVRRYRRDNEQRQRLLERQHPVYTGW
ncbi:Putative ephrin-receptor like [Desmophyllum pertusum]|uniref:Ephrin-receptor like n=1 Tax=Desmophyllum pertusum TaxID=174260 RepID=A0A9W9YEA4_9CNID|nr:Putative ephrin-receptor like [Desmophyllum pertusum]